MKLVQSYNNYSGYKLNEVKTQILPINDSPSQDIQQASQMEHKNNKISE